MAWFRDISLRGKLTLIITVTSTVVLLLACLAVVAYDVAAIRRTMVLEVETLAGIVAENSTAALSFRDPEAAEQVLSALRADPHILAACIYSEGGEPFARYTRRGASMPVQRIRAPKGTSSQTRS